jgi:hypothetical protein
VLICPACQSSVDWLGELDQCPVCSSVHLVRRLGEVECRDCGYVREPTGGDPADLGPAPGVPPGSVATSEAGAAGSGAAGPGAAGSVAAPEAGGAAAADPDADIGATPGLAEEVELALARVLGRGRPARIG